MDTCSHFASHYSPPLTIIDNEQDEVVGESHTKQVVQKDGEASIQNGADFYMNYLLIFYCQIDDITS